MSTEVDVPAPLDRFIEAVNGGDTEGFLSFFSDDGVVDDWGRRFAGHDEIRGWSDREFIGAQGTFTSREVSIDGAVVTIDAMWESNHYTGPSRFAFEIEGDRIKEMRITSSE